MTWSSPACLHLCCRSSKPTVATSGCPKGPVGVPQMPFLGDAKVCPKNKKISVGFPVSLHQFVRHFSRTPKKKSLLSPLPKNGGKKLQTITAKITRQEFYKGFLGCLSGLTLRECQLGVPSLLSCAFGSVELLLVTVGLPMSSLQSIGRACSKTIDKGMWCRNPGGALLQSKSTRRMHVATCKNG